MRKKKKPIQNAEKISAAELEKQVLKLFKHNPKRRYDLGTVAHQLGLQFAKKSVEESINKLIKKNLIALHESGKFIYAGETVKVEKGWHLAKGQVDMARSGAAYIVCNGLGKDVYVPASKTSNALDGDTVSIKWKLSPRGNPEGEIIEVVERRSNSFTGVLHITKRYAILIPDKNNIAGEIHIALEDLNGAILGDKVVVEIVRWHEPPKHPNLKGVVSLVLGKGGDSNTEMMAILLKNGFNVQFPKNVNQESEAIPDIITEAEIARRRDFRGVTTFTIDPLTAKDFDDALSIRTLENGNYEIGVHIADVTHYLQENSSLDREAVKRSTSVYLVDRVAPMLPEKLSNELCSLRPDEDKLTFSAVFEFSKDGKMLTEWFGKTIIHSNRRFTYEEAQEVIEKGEGDYAEELKVLNSFSKKMREERAKHGSINFEAPEVYFRLDETGKPVELRTKERKDAHLLIEDFMLLANKQVAGYIYKKKETEQAIPFVYRVHDTPDMEKLTELSRFASKKGYKLDFKDTQKISKTLNKLIEESNGKDEGPIFQQIAIRCMAKAVYTTDNIGHYGLGYEHYVHFTSPIRRYADVLVHRILERNLAEERYRMDKARLEDLCVHISKQERKAMECERESIKYKQVEFMSDRVGEEFDGIITGIAEHGLFIEMTETRCEGRVTMDRMPEPFLVEALQIKGKRSGMVLRMGDKVRVKVTATNIQKRQIDLEMIF